MRAKIRIGLGRWREVDGFRGGAKAKRVVRVMKNRACHAIRTTTVGHEKGILNVVKERLGGLPSGDSDLTVEGMMFVVDESSIDDCR